MQHECTPELQKELEMFNSSLIIRESLYFEMVESMVHKPTKVHHATEATEKQNASREICFQTQ